MTQIFCRKGRALVEIDAEEADAGEYVKLGEQGGSVLPVSQCRWDTKGE